MKQLIIDGCLEKINNRFELVKTVTLRAKQLNKGLKPLVDVQGEKNIMVSMKEVAAGKVYIADKEPNEDDE